MFLTICHTNLSFNDPEIVIFRKTCGKRRKFFSPAISHVPTMFSNLKETEIIILATLNLSPANAF